MPKLSVIVPVYNEERTIARVIEEAKNTEIKGMAKEIIAVDDFSTDNTREMLRRAKGKHVKILFHKKNMGKGAAVKTGISNSTGDIILIQDADLEYSPKEYGRLLEPIINGNADVVYGSRINAIRKNLKKMYKLHYIGNVLLTLLTNLLYNANITDMETGYKVFRKEAVNGINLRARRFDFEPEITAKLLKKGYKIHEVPINFFGRKFSEGKKITWIDGLKAIYYLFKYRFAD
ncbi:glycosyltransferase family 2 protein [Candidatus Woesearchaeota archaeon]|nr:glycosyltransferase family 2 protein [Candidatus Woesearchaeota archaeon]